MRFDETVFDQWMDLREEQQGIAFSNDKLIKALKKDSLTGKNEKRFIALMREQLEYKKFEVDEYEAMNHSDYTQEVSCDAEDCIDNCIEFIWLTDRIRWDNRLKMLNDRLKSLLDYVKLENNPVWEGLDAELDDGKDLERKNEFFKQFGSKMTLSAIEASKKLESLYDDLGAETYRFWKYFRNKDMENVSLQDWVLRLELYKHKVSLEAFAENDKTWNKIKERLLRFGELKDEFLAMCENVEYEIDDADDLEGLMDVFIDTYDEAFDPDEVEEFRYETDEEIEYLDEDDLSDEEKRELGLDIEESETDDIEDLRKELADDKEQENE